MISGDDRNIGRRLLPEGAGPARLIVCERTGAWAVALRRELAAAGVHVHETRSVAECWEVLARCPAGFLVVELTPAAVDPLLARMASLEREFPLARVAVVTERRFRDCQWPLREAGAVDFVVSPRELAPLARAIVRHLEQAPEPPRSLTERIWAGLPWGRRA